MPTVTAAVLTVALGACSGSAPSEERPTSPAVASPNPVFSSILSGAQKRAFDKQAQSTARNALVAALVYGVDHSSSTAMSFKGIAVKALTELEPSLQWLADKPSDAPTIVSFSSDASWFQAAVWSRSGMCFAIGAAADDGNPVYAKQASGECRASAFPRSAFNAAGW